MKSEIPDSVKTIVLTRLRAKLARERLQKLLICEDDLFHETVRAKLDGLNESPQFWNFSRCGGDEVHFDCKDCGQHHQFVYRCSLRWCPKCSWKLSEERKKIIGLWATKIKQPKHLILTMRNFDLLTKRQVKFFQKKLLALRHRKIFRQVRGGCCSIEFTHEKKGWHMHAHLLLDVRYLDAFKLTKIWAKLLGQEIAILKIIDVRGQDYVKEVAKYVVEGSEIAKWDGNLINQFVTAIQGRRFFTSFGSLRKLAPQIKEQLAFTAREKYKCECGSRNFKFGGQSDSPTANGREVETVRYVPHVPEFSSAALQLRDRLDREARSPLLPHI